MILLCLDNLEDIKCEVFYRYSNWEEKREDIGRERLFICVEF